MRLRDVDSGMYAPAAVLTTLWLLAIAPMLVGRAVMFVDVCRIYVSLEQAFRDALWSGSFPLWDSRFSAGFPLFAEGVLGPLYPSTLLFLPLAPERAIQMSIALHLLVIGLGMIAYLRALGLGSPAVTFGASMLMLSAPVMARLMYLPVIAPLAWMPWLFLAGHRMATGSARWAASAGLMLGLQISAGHPQPVLLTLIMWLPYVVLVARGAGSTWSRVIWSSAGTAATALALSAFALFARFELFLQSARAAGVSPPLAGSFPPRQLITFIVPFAFGVPGESDDYWGVQYFNEMATYVGLSGLGFAAAGIWLERRHGIVRFFSTVGLIATIVAFGSYFAPSAVLLAIPPFPYFRAPSRFLLLTTFALCTLAAFGIDTTLRAAPEVRRRIGTIFADGALALVVTLAIAHATLIVARENVLAYGRAYYAKLLAGAPSGEQHAASAKVVAIFQGLLETTNPLSRRVIVPVATLALCAAALGWARLRLGNRTVAAMLVAGLAIDLLVFAYAYTPWSNALPSGPPPFATALASHSDPRVLSRIETSGKSCDRMREVLAPNIAPLYGLPFLGMWSPLQLRDQDVALEFSRRRGADRDRCDHLFLRPLEAWGVTHVACRGDLHDPTAALAAKGPPGTDDRLYALSRALPRAYVVPTARLVRGSDEAASLLVQGHDPRDAVLIMDADASRERGGGRGTASIESADVRRLKIRVRSSGPAWLVVNDTHYPGWRATVNDRETPIYKANGFVRAVAVAAGESVVEMVYCPRWVIAALLTSVASAVVAGVLLFRRGAVEQMRLTTPG